MDVQKLKGVQLQGGGALRYLGGVSSYGRGPLLPVAHVTPRPAIQCCSVIRQMALLLISAMCWIKTKHQNVKFCIPEILFFV